MIHVECVANREGEPCGCCEDRPTKLMVFSGAAYGRPLRPLMKVCRMCAIKTRAVVNALPADMRFRKVRPLHAER